MHLCFDNPQKDHPANVFSDFDCLQKCDGGLGMDTYLCVCICQYLESGILLWFGLCVCVWVCWGGEGGSVTTDSISP